MPYQFSKVTVSESERAGIIAAQAKRQWEVYSQVESGRTYNGEAIYIITFVKHY